VQRICCAIRILEFIHCQPTGGNGHFSPTAGSEVERHTAIGRAIALRAPARDPAIERRIAPEAVHPNLIPFRRLWESAILGLLLGGNGGVQIPYPFI